ncbi:MAG: pyruvate synthase subunit beta [Desulfobacteraceae bacterium]|nr:pyruvate synthase subunit beta [Desulfobacteraceae bacterium]
MIKDELIHPGMSSCQGCGAALSMKIALKGLGRRTVVVFPACCFCVFVGGYPYSSLEVPIVHCPFETAAIVASGVSAAMDTRGESDVTVMVWAGDGGTFDIGLQSLSGAAERNENILYVCYDNEAYMNTGIQRSSATPVGAWTTTTPEGSIKEESKKDIEQIMLAHHIPYMATASAAYPDDMYRKFKNASHITGTKFIHILASCPPGWRIDPSQSVRATRMATQAKIFPIYEVRRWRFSKEKRAFEENWEYTINVRPEKEVSVEEYVRTQGRFRHMTDEMIQDIQKKTDQRWDELVEKAEKSKD